MTDLAPDATGLSAPALDVLMPMHVRILPDGRIGHVGATLAKLDPETRLVGRALFDVFEIRRPAGMSSIERLADEAGTALYLRFRDGPEAPLRGVFVPTTDGGAVLNLSFRIAVVDALRHHDLSSADFAPTDLTIEMLYLAEANGAAMSEWRSLNERLQEAREEAERQAFSDTLTGLGNRRALQATLDDWTAMGIEFAIMQLDLDLFKAVNDTLGHAAGDHVLVHVADILREETRRIDVAIRAGGDEFVVLLNGVHKHDDVKRVAQRILERVEVPSEFEGNPCQISASIGLAFSIDYKAPSTEMLMQHADAALYASKNAGRARITSATEIALAGEDGDTPDQG